MSDELHTIALAIEVSQELAVMRRSPRKRVPHVHLRCARSGHDELHNFNRDLQQRSTRRYSWRRVDLGVDEAEEDDDDTNEQIFLGEWTSEHPGIDAQTCADILALTATNL